MGERRFITTAGNDKNGGDFRQPATYNERRFELGVGENDVGESIAEHQIETELGHGVRTRKAKHHLAQLYRTAAVVHSDRQIIGV